MKKKSSKKSPPPPKNTRCDIILDPERHEVLQKLSGKLGIKANTKILFYCADYYLNDKPRYDLKITELTEQNRYLLNQLSDI